MHTCDYVSFVRISRSFSLSLFFTHALRHTHTYTCTHARTHTHTHTNTQGGWGEASEAVAAMIAAAEKEETTAGSVLERVGWVVASLLPLAPQQRQHVLQSLSPDMRAMALSHLLNRVNERYDTTRAYVAHEQEHLDVSSPSRPTASRGLAAVAQKVLPSTVKILPTLLRDSQSKGSGFVVSHSTREDGGLDAMIVTNSHVAGLTVGMEVVLYDGRVFKGSLVGRHRELDIALVQVYLYIYICIYTHKHLYVYIFLYVCVYICMYACVCIDMQAILLQHGL